jgi:hypothetical protein
MPADAFDSPLPFTHVGKGGYVNRPADKGGVPSRPERAAVLWKPPIAEHDARMTRAAAISKSNAA